jgi:hypothetical protein
MLEQTDQRLIDWAKEVTDNAKISLNEPQAAEEGITLHLMEIVPVPPARGLKRPPIQLQLRYLVTARADKPEKAHAWLDKLIVAAMDTEDFEVEAMPVSSWLAYDMPPRAAFVLKVLARQERLEPPVKFVTKPLVTHIVNAVSMQGVILAPNDVPIGGASVEITKLNLYAISDDNGVFRFPRLPNQPDGVELKIRAKGREQTIRVEQITSPVVINFNIS